MKLWRFYLGAAALVAETHPAVYHFGRILSAFDHYGLGRCAGMPVAPTTKAVVMDTPGPPQALQVRDLPIPILPSGKGVDEGGGVRVDLSHDHYQISRDHHQLPVAGTLTETLTESGYAAVTWQFAVSANDFPRLGNSTVTAIGPNEGVTVRVGNQARPGRTMIKSPW